MKRVVAILFFLSLTLLADVEQAFPSMDILKSGVKIIDVRTPGEWRETGLLKGAIPITFFDERGNYDVRKFLDELHKYVKKGEKFALICRSGSRTGMISNFLGYKLGYDVINLKGGMLYAKKRGLPIVPYRQ